MGFRVGLGVSGFRGLGVWGFGGLGFRCLGFRVSGFRGLGFGIGQLKAVVCRHSHPKATQTLPRNLSFAWGGTFWAEGPCH